MKSQILSAVALLAATGAAAPGGCQEYSYDIPSCDSCHYPTHESWGDSCQKECPKEHRQCKDEHQKSYSSFQFELQYSEEVSCPKDYHYDLQVKIEACSSGNSQECLNVYYADGNYNNKRSSISESNLGIYLQEQNSYNPHDFNYNNYCSHDKCEVPTENLPSYPDLCEKEIYLAVGNNQCYDNYNYDDYSQSTKYVKVKVSCNEEHEQEEDHCKEECCCYQP